jgi:type IV pilus assembly protein PilB
MANANSIEDLLKDPSILSKKGSSGAQATKPTDDDDDEKSTQVLERKMQSLKLKDAEQQAEAKAKAAGKEYIDLAAFPISPEALSLIPKERTLEKKVVVFLHVGDEIRIGAVDATDKEIEEIAYQVGEEHHAKTEIYQISEHSFESAMKIYDKVPVYKKPPSGVVISEDEINQFEGIGTDFSKLQKAIEKTSITDMVTLLIAGALQAGSSDIHVEAEEKAIKVRYRMDGILHDVADIDKKLWPKIISRIKLLAKLKLNITTKPQDGRFTIRLSDENVDVRVSALPTAYGESVVMRLLRSAVASLQFVDLGLIGLSEERMKEQIARPNGMIITTGPTGSGKTTTLYAILNHLNQEGTKIITLEDPIEYRLEGINQSQIDKSKDYSFAGGLKSILRQDPDIVMVGEMRDLETADVAINAALTGHLVLSTIHTNSAAGAVPRFLAMGVKPFLLAPAINAIMGQRLVRRICSTCEQKELKPTEKEMARIKEILEAIPADHPDRPDMSNMTFFKAEGCDVCNNTGYKGRVGIFEILVMSPEIEKVILSGKVSENDMQELAIKNNMLTMVQDGLIKAMKGLTTIEEVFRVSE